MIYFKLLVTTPLTSIFCRTVWSKFTHKLRMNSSLCWRSCSGGLSSITELSLWRKMERSSTGSVGTLSSTCCLLMCLRKSSQGTRTCRENSTLLRRIHFWRTSLTLWITSWICQSTWSQRIWPSKSSKKLGGWRIPSRMFVSDDWLKSGPWRPNRPSKTWLMITWSKKELKMRDNGWGLKSKSFRFTNNKLSSSSRRMIQTSTRSLSISRGCSKLPLRRLWPLTR